MLGLVENEKTFIIMGPVFSPFRKDGLCHGPVRLSNHVEMYVNHVDLRKIMHRFMSQYAPERTKKKSEFVEIIHASYFHRHVDHIQC